MISDTGAFLRYFDAVHRRMVRDVAALPPQAGAWKPPEREGEAGWGIGQIVAHVGASRLYFASAYRQEGWLFPDERLDYRDQARWIPYLEETAAQFHRRLDGTPNEWLNRRIEMIDTPGASISGWRALMMMVEHEVHHRSQIDTYAGLEGWPVPDIYGRSYESIDALQPQQRATSN
jgi:uncharacterized damage-inducible protein DinB